MPMYVTNFTCAPTEWPTDRQGQIDVWTAMVKDADTLVREAMPIDRTIL